MKIKILIFLIDLFAKTWKFKITNKPSNFNSVIAFWHGKMLPVWFFFKQHNPLGIVSLSKDGEILSQLLNKWNYKLIRGSSSKGGKEVIENVVNANHFGPILITPDGPRGPKEEMKAGAIIISQRTSKPLILCGVEISKKILLKKSWDNFEIPLPFTKICINFSDEISFDKKLDYDEVNDLRLELSNKLKLLSKSLEN
ncbi:MAG: lysophospholipid acyltransferase family protein [Candidatus Kapabacteria bacterium]|nr:lysophospholipid acyltransferase family protein [Candidatus Kapabacteria bacterium]